MKGDNVEIVLKDGKAVFVVDLAVRLKESASGKSTLIASAGGALSKDLKGLGFSLNVYEKKAA